MRHDFTSTPYCGLSALSCNHGDDSHISVTHGPQTFAIANLAERTTAKRYSSVNTPDPLGIAAIIRAQTARDFLATLAEWQRASGKDRAYWRKYVRMHIAEERARLARSRAALHAAATQARTQRTA